MTGRVVDSEGRYRNAAGASSLSEVLVARAPQTYSLSARACEGIIRRAEKRGKPLPSILRDALEWVIARDSSTTREAQRGGVGYEPGQSPTLTADCHQPAIVSLQSDGTSSNGNQNGCGYNDDGSAYTVNGRDKQAVCIQGSMVGREDANGPNGGCNVDCSFTLNTIDRHAVAFAQNQRGEVRLEGL